MCKIDFVAKGLFVAGAVCLCCRTLSAAEIFYDTASGVMDLSQAAAWVGGTAPDENDVAVLAGAGGSFTLGADVAWKGLVYSNLTDMVTLAGTHTLTLGAKGISPGAAVSPKNSLALKVPVVLACDQEWYAIGSYVSALAIYGGVKGPGKLAICNYPYQASGWFGLRSKIETDFSAHATTMNVDSADANDPVTFSDAVDVGWGCGLYLYDAGNGEKKFSDIFKGRQVVNDGRVGLGGSNLPERRADILFEDGDSVIGGDYSMSPSVRDDPSQQAGDLYQHLGRFHMTGGLVSNNMFIVRAGDYVQEGGTVWLRNSLRTANVAGYGQRLLVNGPSAKLSAGSVKLGRSNGEKPQNWLVVSNSDVTVRGDVCLTEESRSGIGANTWLSLVGGSLSAAGMSFGDPSSSATSSNAVARLDVTNGVLAIGRNGLTVAANSWNKDLADDASGASWYRARLADAKLRATAGNESTAALKLEKTVEMEVDAGAQMTQLGPLSGPATLVKTGAGTLTLSATCAWTGETIVSNGTLVVGLGAPKTPYIRFRADDLALAEDATIEVWQSVSSDKSHTNAFTRATTSAVKIPAVPTYRTNRFNGHAAAVFNGTSQGLAMTGGTAGGSSDGPLNNASNATVAVVFRATSGTGASGTGNPAFGTGGILGQYYAASNNRWMMGLAGDGTLCAGLARAVKSGAQDTARVSVWPTTFGDVRDGQAHVAIFNWTTGEKLRLNLDGQWTEIADALDFQRISQNRLLMGVTEAPGGSDFKYFGGEIAEVVIYRDDKLTTEEIDAIAFALAGTYGATYVPSVATAGGSAPGESSLPAATGLWRADDLTQTAGESVTVWKDSTANGGEFNTTVGTAILSGTTPPTVASETMNGHKAVSFDGEKNMLGMTGGKGPTYIGEGASFTVALVLRPKNAGGEMRASWPTSVGVLGQAFKNSNDQNKWAIGVSGSPSNLPAPGQQMMMGIRDGSADTISQHGTPRDMLDGRVHVVICSFGSDLTINVDGVRATRRNATTAARTAARTTLGRLEEVGSGSTWYNGGYFKGDIAEIRFYKDAALTVAQQNALGRELALKYGADAGGFFAAGESAFLSTGITVAEGAKVLGAGEGLRLPSGAVIGGAGTVSGRLVLGANTVLRATADAGGKIVPLALGTVEWPAEGVTVALPEVPNLKSGKLCTWTSGEAPDISKWTLVGGDPQARLIVNAQGKTVFVKIPQGLLVIVR